MWKFIKGLFVKLGNAILRLRCIYEKFIRRDKSFFTDIFFFSTSFASKYYIPIIHIFSPFFSEGNDDESERGGKKLNFIPVGM